MQLMYEPVDVLHQLARRPDGQRKPVRRRLAGVGTQGVWRQLRQGRSAAKAGDLSCWKRHRALRRCVLRRLQLHSSADALP